MLTTRLHLGSWLRVIGALPLIPLYAFVILTRNSPESSQLHLLGLVVVFNAIVLGFHLCFIGVDGCCIGHMNFAASVSYLCHDVGRRSHFNLCISYLCRNVGRRSQFIL